MIGRADESTAPCRILCYGEPHFGLWMLGSLCQRLNLLLR